jgi:YidC/Oxa1 family membrane protein insertase
VDKKSLLGLGLIAAILGIWLYINGPTEEQIARSKKIKDSIELVQKELQVLEAQKIAQRIMETSQTPELMALPSDSAVNAAVSEQYRDFTVAIKGNKEVYTLENEKLKAYISNKGGQIVKVELKGYHRPDSEEDLILFEGDSTKFSLILNAYDRSRFFSTDSFYFKPVQKSATQLVLRLETSIPGSFIEYSYQLNPGDYTVKSAIRLAGMDKIISQTEDQLQLNWSMLFPTQEKHIIKEKEAATVYFKQDLSDPDYINPMKEEVMELNDANIKWVSFKQQFFNASIIADNSFGKAGSFVKTSLRPDSDTIVKAVSSELGIPYNHGPDEKFSFQFYFGPNHYNTLEQYDVQLEKIIPTGWSIFSYINKWLVIPLFNWKFLNVLGMGMIILILTVIVKIVLLPISYKTYMSGAKMRVLKPETDAINAKYTKNADPMKKQQEQMALYRKAGVNPLSGCLPLLLQFPILIALFNFVPAAIELRQENFLWASDLSTYDSVWTFGNVPFISWAYGDHVSLFALLMFVSTIVYTYMNQSMMPQQGNAQMPGMKFMMYFMPVIFLAVMNKYSAGLSWYYFLANMFTFLQNFVIRKIVSDNKIRAKLEANMKKPVKSSGFQKRLEEMAKQRQQQQQTLRKK